MNISRATAEELLDLLDALSGFLDKYVDVEDGDHGIPEPNWPMRLQSRVNEAAEYLEREMAVQDDPS